MIAFLPPILAAGAAMIVLLCTSPNRVAGEPKQRAEPGFNELERWRP